MAYIREIFSSIQGEGPLVGYKQLFIRFCRCNLSCAYCDTDFDIDKSKNYSVSELLNIVEKYSDCHSISLTGGEPLLEYEFIKEFAKQSPLPLYLETNGTLVDELNQIINCVDYVASDIKLPSCTCKDTNWQIHDEFIKIASRKNAFAKAVFNECINDDEIEKMTSICSKHNVQLILQPMMIANKPSVSSDFMLATLNKCLKLYNNVRLIPQVHKFINVY